MSGPTDIPAWLVAATAFPTFFGEPASTRIDRRWGLSIGQNIYTPENILASQRVIGDRPYAGWLYIAGILQYTHYKKDERDREVQTRQDTLMLDVGVVGPSAGGEFVQNNVHNIIRVERANGWGNQLHDEPTLGLTFERRWRTGATTIFDEPRLELDFVPRAAVALGNVATYASVGGQMRFGRDLSIDFGAARPRPALPGSDAYAGAGFAWYLFAGLRCAGLGAQHVRRRQSRRHRLDGDPPAVRRRGAGRPRTDLRRRAHHLQPRASHAGVLRARPHHAVRLGQRHVPILGRITLRYCNPEFVG